MDNKTYLECAYVGGNLYKAPTNSFENNEIFSTDVLAVETLTTGEISTYPSLNEGVVSDKTLSGITKRKTYNWVPNQDLMDFTSDYVSIRGDGVFEDVSEKYFKLSNPLGLEEVATNYSLPMPITGALVSDFFDDFDNWGMRPLEKTVIASVKFDINNRPIMLKLYRGGYMPTDTEIQEAKDYWANVSG